MRGYSKLVNSISSYALISIIEKIIPFLMVPVFARILDAEGFGMYLLALSIVDFVMPIISVGSESYLLREYYDQPNTVFKYLTVKILLLLLVVAFVLLVLTTISLIVSGNEVFKLGDVLLIVGLSLFRQVNRVRLTVYRAKEQIRSYGIFALTSSLLRNVLAYIILIHFGGWSGILIGYLIIQLMFAVFTVFSLCRSIDLRVVSIFSGYQGVIKFGVPVIGHRLGAWLGNSGIRLVTSNVVGVGAVGLLGAAGFYQTILNVIHQSFNSAFVPYLYGLLKSEQILNLRRVVKITLFYYCVMFLVCLFLALLAINYHNLIFGEGFVEAKRLIVPLIATAGLNGLYKIHVNILFYLKETLFVFRITAFSGLLAIVAAYFLGNMFGIEGVVWSIFLGQLIAYFFVLILAQKAYPLPWCGTIQWWLK